jgi:hypothetical protein
MCDLLVGAHGGHTRGGGHTEYVPDKKLVYNSTNIML